VICASDESQQPIHAAPIANQRLQNQQPGSSWGLVGVGDQALAIEGRCRRGFQVFFTAVLAADRNINYSQENRFRALMARSQGPWANIQLQCRSSKASVPILRCKKIFRIGGIAALNERLTPSVSFVVMAERHGTVKSCLL